MTSFCMCSRAYPLNGLTNQPNPAGICLFQVIMETPEQSEIFTKLTIKTSEWCHWLCLNKFLTWFWRFHCWLWTSKCRFGIHTSEKMQSTKDKHNPANVYLFQVNNRNTRTRCEICSKLKTVERHQNGFFVNKCIQTQR